MTLLGRTLTIRLTYVMLLMPLFSLFFLTLHVFFGCVVYALNVFPGCALCIPRDALQSTVTHGMAWHGAGRIIFAD